MTSDLKSLKPIAHRSANELVYERVREAISSGKFAPGEKLSTRNVAAQLGVSQMPVREAFHRLVAEGGMVKLENRTIALPDLNLKEFSELTELRLLLEGTAAAKAAQRTTKRKLSKIASLVEQLDETENNSEKHLELNRLLHFQIYEMADSDSLVQMIELLWLRVGPILRFNTKRDETVASSNQQHEAMLEAMQTADSDGARRAVELDISEAADVVKAHLIADGKG
ncbi:GntR family transcriptional regulator [Marinovum sp. 2_MG-2023]|uniref:GntR family transcriptional regulator n=1 Tax=unclassified Marinovum TaxID=2647166 RepID=UPI0026E39CFC|nr:MULTISPECIES: GntR family transcriptional regulator [unclassified Marinovum]MDO6729965.1 GntR family transcriptional regulator [Marinovum sp. 2_MG-2023]MDO6779779.1 GntR family transcriptional regulator [Marinovum sp. 1_MG-2023]